MILATRKNATRDGELLIVSRDHSKGVVAGQVAPCLQTALDNWRDCAPKLLRLYEDLNLNRVPNIIDIDGKALHAPLPRAYAWLDGSAYLNHVRLVRKARGAEPPPTLETDPLMYQGGSDSFLGPNDDICVADEDWGADFESEVAVITDDVPMGISARNAIEHICLIVICNDVSLRNLIPTELAKGFGFLHSKPSTAFAPFAITPDELGPVWRDGRVHLPLETWLDGERFGNPDAGLEMHFSFADLIAHAAKTRKLGAGTIIGGGTVSNKDQSRGSSCIAEKRCLEKINSGEARTSFMRHGQEIKIEMLLHGQSVFGAIHQKVTRPNKN